MLTCNDSSQFEPQIAGFWLVCYQPSRLRELKKNYRRLYGQSFKRFCTWQYYSPWKIKSIFKTLFDNAYVITLLASVRLSLSKSLFSKMFRPIAKIRHTVAPQFSSCLGCVGYIFSKWPGVLVFHRDPVRTTHIIGSAWPGPWVSPSSLGLRSFSSILSTSTAALTRLLPLFPSIGLGLHHGSSIPLLFTISAVVFRRIITSYDCEEQRP